MYLEKDGKRMKKMMTRYRCSKYRSFTGGLLFALISCVALLLCFSGLKGYQNTGINHILLPFIIAIISMILGFVTMFHHSYVTK